MTNDQRRDNAFDDFDRRMDQVPGILSETAIEYFGERFIEKSWEGQPWAEYNPRKTKGRKEPDQGSLMLRTSKLKASIRETLLTPDRVRITAGNSKVPYARVRNEGFRGTQYVRPHHRNTRFGRKQIKGHSRRVIAIGRRYLGPSATVNARFQQRLQILFQS